jgi:hypothetical protein
MSGTTNQLFEVDDVLGDDILGDRETAEADRALTGLSEALDDADESVDDIAADVGGGTNGRDGADGADGAHGSGQVGDREGSRADIVAAARGALDDADEELDDLSDAIAAEDPTPATPAPDLAGVAETVTRNPQQVAEAVGDDTTFAWVTPTNNSGAQALARLALDGSTLRVTIEGGGFTPGQAHAITLSGFADGQISDNPTITDDTNADGILSTEELAAVVGPVLLNLGSATADAQGNISFTSELTPDAAALDALQTRLDGRHIGIDGLDTPGEATGYLATTPAAGGRTLDIAGELGAVLEVLTALSPSLASDAFRTLLQAQAPYILAPDGEGPIAPEGEEADDDGISEYVALIPPANNSGVIGVTRLTIDEGAGTLAVDLEVGGLTPGEEHPIHIHGFSTGQPSLTPNAELDSDNDGFLEGGEVAGVLGFILLAVTEDGSISDANLAANFPVADEDGRISLEQTYSFDLEDPAEATIFAELQDRLTGRQIEVHGAELLEGQGEGTSGEAMGQGGYSIGLPVATGAVLPVSGLSGALAAGVGYVIQSELSDEEATLAGLLDAVRPAFEDGLAGATTAVPQQDALIA